MTTLVGTSKDGNMQGWEHAMDGNLQECEHVRMRTCKNGNMLGWEHYVSGCIC